VLILLHRDRDIDNPFSFEVRKKWVLNYCLLRDLCNISVPERLDCGQKDEYCTLGGKNFLVVTTNETDSHYVSLGLRTLNHHRKPLSGSPKTEACSEWWNDRICDSGQVIREKLRAGDSCEGLVSEKIELEAFALINKLEHI